MPVTNSTSSTVETDAIVAEDHAIEYLDHLVLSGLWQKQPRPNHRVHFDTFLTMAKPGRIFQAGCRSAGLAIRCQQAGFDFYGSDPSLQMVLLGEQQVAIHGGVVSMMSLHSPRLPAGSFQGIACVNSLWSIPKYHLASTLGSYWAALDDCGLLLCILPKLPSREGWIKPDDYLGRPIWYASYTQEELQYALEAAGFRFINCIEHEADDPERMQSYFSVLAIKQPAKTPRILH